MDVTSKLWINRPSGNILERQDRKKNSPISVKSESFLTVFLDYNVVVHYEFLPPGHMVNKENYLEVIRRLRRRNTK